MMGAMSISPVAGRRAGGGQRGRTGWAHRGGAHRDCAARGRRLFRGRHVLRPGHARRPPGARAGRRRAAGDRAGRPRAQHAALAFLRGRAGPGGRAGLHHAERPGRLRQTRRPAHQPGPRHDPGHRAEEPAAGDPAGQPGRARRLRAARSRPRWRRASARPWPPGTTSSASTRAASGPRYPRSAAIPASSPARGRTTSRPMPPPSRCSSTGRKPTPPIAARGSAGCCPI